MADTLTAVVLCGGADEEAGVYQAQRLKETITKHDNNPELLKCNPGMKGTQQQQELQR